METPGSNVRMTRSRARQLTPHNGKPPVTPAAASTRKLDRLPLGDMTNDSPIAGVVPDIQKGNTPRGAKVGRRSSMLPSATKKGGDNAQDSCIEGEELLRAQVKLLLEKQANKGLEPSPVLGGAHPLLSVELSPLSVVGPTPANTPAVAGGKAGSEVQQEMTTEEANGLLEKLATPGAVPYEEVCRLLEALEMPLPVEESDVTEEETSVDAERTENEEEPSTNVPILIALPVMDNIEEVPEVELPVTRALCFDSYDVDVDPVSEVVQHTPKVRSVIVIPSPGSDQSAGRSAMMAENSPNAAQSAYIEDSVSEVGSPASLTVSLSEALDMAAEEEGTDEVVMEEQCAPKSPPSTWSVGVNVGSPMVNKVIEPDVAEAESQRISSEYAYQSQSNTPASVTKTNGQSIWERRKASGIESEEENSGWGTVDEEDEDDGCEFTSQLDCNDLIAQMNTMGIAPLRGLPCATGTHIRFVEDDDNGELKEELEVLGPDNESMAAAALRLRGLPTPKGKHTRFDD